MTRAEIAMTGILCVLVGIGTWEAGFGIKTQPEVRNVAAKNTAGVAASVAAARAKETQTDDGEIYEVTAYCPCRECCGHWSDGLTATGKSALKRGVAVDPAVIALGSIVTIEGAGQFEADDVGGAIKGKRIDLRYPTHKAALTFGRQQRRAWVKRK